MTVRGMRMWMVMWDPGLPVRGEATVPGTALCFYLVTGIHGFHTSVNPLRTTTGSGSMMWDRDVAGASIQDNYGMSWLLHQAYITWSHHTLPLHVVALSTPAGMESGVVHVLAH